MATQRKRSLVVCHCDCRVPATQCIAYWTVAVYCILHVVFETSIPRLSLHTGKRKKSKRTESETGRCQVDLVDGHGRAEGVELERAEVDEPREVSGPHPRRVRHSTLVSATQRFRFLSVSHYVFIWSVRAEYPIESVERANRRRIEGRSREGRERETRPLDRGRTRDGRRPGSGITFTIRNSYVEKSRHDCPPHATAYSE